jgi:hypothetical protein
VKVSHTSCAPGCERKAEGDSLQDRGLPCAIIAKQQEPVGNVTGQGVPQLDFQILEPFEIL